MGEKALEFRPALPHLDRDKKSQRKDVTVLHIPAEFEHVIKKI